MQTVIGVFDDRLEARRAIERLVDAGFPREDVHLQEQAASDADDEQAADLMMQSPEREIAVDPRALAGLSHFFSRLFGRDHRATHAQTYSEAVRRGSSVVVADTEDPEQADQAAQLMHELGAINVDERARQWRASGWAGNAEDVSAPPAGGRGGVRIFERVSLMSVREIVALRKQQPAPDQVGRSDADTGRAGEAQGANRNAEPERAYAADRTSERRREPRDPEAGSRGPVNRKSGMDE